MSMNTLAVVALALASRRTTPPCSTTKKRSGSPGACKTSVGRANVSPPNIGASASVLDALGRACARQLGLGGRASSPYGEGGGGGVGGVGARSLPPHPRMHRRSPVPRLQRNLEHHNRSRNQRQCQRRPA